MGTIHERIVKSVEFIGNSMHSIIITLIYTWKKDSFFGLWFGHVAARNTQIEDVINSIDVTSKEEKNLVVCIADTPTHKVILIGGEADHTATSENVLVVILKLIGVDSWRIRTYWDITDPSVGLNRVERMIDYCVVSETQRINPLVSCLGLIDRNWAVIWLHLEEGIVVLEKDQVELPCNLGIWIIRIWDEGLLYVVILGVIEVDGISILRNNDIRPKWLYRLGGISKLQILSANITIAKNLQKQ